jgi:DNA-binding response OmpR family regulator
MTNPPLNVLLIEDEIKIAEFVIPELTANGFHVTHLSNGEEGLAAILNSAFDLVILDVMLPGLDGFEVLRNARQMGRQTPVIMLSARSELPDRLEGFAIGADDYLPKPFFVEELIARIRAVLARKRGDVQNEISVSDFTINKVSHQANWGGFKAKLSQREFTLVEYLIRSPNHIFSRAQILKHVWGIEFNPETNVVDVCIQRIRKKLNRQTTGTQKFPIDTVRGVGYRFKSDNES